MLSALKSTIVKQPLTTEGVAKSYQKAPSLSEKLPWREYDPESQCFLLQDGRSVAVAFELGDVPSEARSENYLEQLRCGLQGVFQDVFTCYYDDEGPWIVQFYVQEELSFGQYQTDFEKYVRPVVRETEFSKAYCATMAEHLKYMTQPEGMFVDDKVSGNVFRGKIRRVRCVIYRNLTRKSKLRKGRDAINDLNIVASTLVSKLEGSGVRVRRMDGEGFYNWMTRWFNPSPQLGGGDTDKLLSMCPYPGDEAMPYGYDFSERFFYSVPESDNEKGLWYFDHKPHKYISITGLNVLPRTGHLTVERQFGNHFYGLFDKFPEGSIFQMTVVIQNQEWVKNHIDHIERSTKKATSMQAQMTREDCTVARRMIESNNFLFPTTLGVYIRGKEEQDLYDAETEVETLLANNGLIVIDGDAELLPIDSYLRFLPMNYNFEFDRRYLSRSRYLSGVQLSQLLPLYGRERGTGHPAIPLYNRAGEPLTIDPFNTSDKDNNSHLLLLGTTGAGKSATCVYLMLNVMAIYKPRLVIVDAGNSFGLLSDYFKEMGLSVNRVEISLNTPVSLNPFSESEKMLSQWDQLDQQHLLEAVCQQEQEIEEASELGENSQTEKLENRDYMGEMSLAAQLMITGGEKKEEAKISRQDRMLILDGLINTAKAAKARGYSQMIPSELADTFIKMAQEIENTEPNKSARLIEMADGIRVFCKDTVSSQFFNQRGAPWPEVDVTILEMGLFKDDGYEAQRALAFMGAMNKTQSMAEANQHDERFTIFFGDECHVVTKNPLTAVAVTKCSKMSRKIGLWLWLATQNVEDFPNEARKLLSMVEFWICLGMSEAELGEVERFRPITAEERSLFRSVRKAAGKYVEGILLCNRFKGLFRNIPPRLALALAMTEKHEKAERRSLMREYGISEIEAAKLMADRMMGKEPDSREIN